MHTGPLAEYPASNTAALPSQEVRRWPTHSTPRSAADCARVRPNDDGQSLCRRPRSARRRFASARASHVERGVSAMQGPPREASEELGGRCRAEPIDTRPAGSLPPPREARTGRLSNTSAGGGGGGGDS